MLFVVKSQTVYMKVCVLNVFGSLVLLSPCILALQGKTYFDEQEQAGNVRKSGSPLEHREYSTPIPDFNMSGAH